MQVGSSEEGKRRGSPSAMVDGDQSAKKARLHIQVKQEANEGGGAVVGTEIKMNMEMSLLHCPICSRPLKPPVFQVGSLHFLAFFDAHSIDSVVQMPSDSCSARADIWLAAAASPPPPKSAGSASTAAASTSPTRRWTPLSRRPGHGAPTRAAQIEIQ